LTPRTAADGCESVTLRCVTVEVTSTAYCRLSVPATATGGESYVQKSERRTLKPSAARTRLSALSEALLSLAPQLLPRTRSTAASRFTKPYPTCQKASTSPPASVTGVAVAWSALRTWSGVSRGFACSSTAAAPATWGEAMLVPDAVAFV
jgi:hypothetical protein